MTNTAEMFRMTELIRKTKHGIPLSSAEIGFIVRGTTAEGDAAIPKSQLAAWLMAVCFRGLNAEETAALTCAMRDSGQRLSWEMLDGPVADKHSTGGVGDKTTLILAPIAAACGVFMPKMSGGGLGHTGGTIDKLESIPGLTTTLSPEKFLNVVRRAGFAVAMQTGSLAPADKVLYKLRSSTETVDSIPLICASIMSKKLAAGADRILLDVKVGSGAFMKNDEDAAELARLMLHAAKSDGRQCAAVLTDMDRPLGMAIGNALEVKEAIEVLQGQTDTPLAQFCITLTAKILRMSGLGTEEECRARALQAAESGEALRRLALMIEGQGGDARVTEDVSLLPQAKASRVLTADCDGFITGMESETVGRASMTLGAGRDRESDPIDPGAGIVLQASVGDAVQKGQPILTMYAADEKLFPHAEELLRKAIALSPEQPPARPMIHAAYSTED